MTSSTTRPILTVPANLHFDDDNIEDNSNENENENENKNENENENKNEEDKYKDSNNEDNNVGYDIYLNENWDSGIGGGLWSTGAALAKYFTTSQHFLQQIKRIMQRRNNNKNNHRHRHRRPRRPLRVLELGSGNGFLSVCLVVAIAVATSNNDMNNNNNNNNNNNYKEENDVDVDAEDEDEDVENNNNDENWPGIEIVVTDTEEHLQLMKDTIDSNLKRILPQILERTTSRTTSRTSPKILYDIQNIASVKEYLWGNKDYDFSSNNDNMSTSDEEDNKSNNTSSNTNENNHFDLIIGSDVAYRDYLHEPLIEALKEFSNSSDTISLIGITMNDTKPIFFNKLIKAGFQYEKLAEHLFDNEYNTCSRQFGIFAITRTK